MKKPLWWTLYKFAMVILLLFSCTLFIIQPGPSLIGIILAFVLWGAQSRRERNFDEERRHKDILNAMSK